MSDQQHKSQVAVDSRKLYVSNLDPTTSTRKTEADLRQLFSKYGEVTSIIIKRNQRHNKVYAFVKFHKSEQAAQAIENLNDEYLGDTKIKVEVQKGPRANREKKEGNSSNAVTCYRCRKVGHFARECTQKPQPREKRERQDREDRRDSRRKHRSRQRKKRVSSSSSSSSDSSSSSSRHRRNKRRNRSSSSSSSSSD